MTKDQAENILYIVKEVRNTTGWLPESVTVKLPSGDVSLLELEKVAKEVLGIKD